MRVRCPYCDSGFSLLNAKVGRFSPTCLSCQQKFQMTITDLMGKPQVVKLSQKDILAEADAQAARPTPRAAGLMDS